MHPPEQPAGPAPSTALAPAGPCAHRRDDADMRGAYYLQQQMIHLLVPSSLLRNKERVALLRRVGAQIEPGVEIFSGCSITRPDLLSVGARTFINFRCMFDGQSRIRIGSDVAVAVGVTVLTSTHRIGGSRTRVGTRVDEPVTIEDGVWIGANVTILPGVTIGHGCVIGAGAVVTRDCAPNGLYVGVPATRIRDLLTDGADRTDEVPSAKA